ncbi:MAG: DUF1385 domain-containing protein [Acetatifactor sp.]|nr:DUF1385 domain-containing protein [Acetatifactor sp.]
MKKNKKKSGYSGIGGQAVLEGIMMKNQDKYAVAVRKPSGDIAVELGNFRGTWDDKRVEKIPFVRGVFSFIDSLVLGMKSLNYSASFYEDEDEGEEETGLDRFLNKISGGHAEGILSGITMVISIVLALGLFIVLPYFITSFFEGYIRNQSLISIIEGLLRIFIFVIYILLISLLKDIRRLFQYHGAEHKCINCIEKGRPLTVHNVMRSSRFHKRCGTSFIFFVLLVSIVLFFFIRVDSLLLKVVLRILLMPVVAGISYEFIRLAGRHDNFLVRIISAPGLWIQRITTKEPDEQMAEVAIKAVEAVFDWKKYLYDEFGYEITDEWLEAENAEGTDK